MTTTTNETRPFNLEHAKAGAPVQGRDGRLANILKFDGRNKKYPLIGTVGKNDYPTQWSIDGSNPDSPGDHLVMAPLGHIEGKPVFVGDRIICSDGGGRTVTADGGMLPEGHKCRWPAPEKVYPETTMTQTEALDSIQASGISAVISISDIPGQSKRCFGELPVDFFTRTIANAALRHAIDAGQVYTSKDYMEQSKQLGRAERALERAGFTDHGAQEWKPPIGEKPAYVRDDERDMAVAKAVLDAASCPFSAVPRYNDLPAIIATVPK